MQVGGPQHIEFRKDKKYAFFKILVFLMHEFHSCILLYKYILAMANDKEPLLNKS